MKRVLVIDTKDSFVYNIVEMLRQLNTDFCVVDVESIKLPMCETFSHVILSPGGGIPQEYSNLMEFIHHYHRQCPMLGICLGHQALAEYFGAALYQLEAPLHGHRAILNILQDTPIFEDVEQNSPIGLYHSWAIDCTSAEELDILAIDDRGITMAFQHRNLPIIGLQFHPESIISHPSGNQMLTNWLAL